MNSKIKRLEDVLVMMTKHATELMLAIPANVLDEMPSYFKNYHRMLADHIKLTCETLLELYGNELIHTLDADLKDLIKSKVEDIQEVMKVIKLASFLKEGEL